MSCVNFTFRGLMAPVFTPINENKLVFGFRIIPLHSRPVSALLCCRNVTSTDPYIIRKINFDLIPKYAKYLSSKGINGVLINGTTGEGVSLTTQERKDVLEAWVQASKPLNQVVMAQVGGTNMEDVKELARHAEELKVSSILCLADLFFRPSNVDELIHYLRLVSSAAPKTPLLYYHIPSFTGININVKVLLEKSSSIPTFAGIKFTDTDLALGSSCVTSAKAHSIFLGCDTLFLPALLQGFDSAIGTTINMFPDYNIKILQYFKEAKIEAAIQEQRKLSSAIEKITNNGKLNWVSSMKKAMRDLTEIDVGPVRDPLI